MSESDFVYCKDRYINTHSCNFNNHNSTGVLYEVIRIIDGVPLFLEDHLERMFKSAEIAGTKEKLPDYETLETIIRGLISQNNKNTGNIQLNIDPLSEDETDIFCGFIPHHYPTEEDYRNGIQTDFLFAERKNPEAKIIQKNLRMRANEVIKEKELFEVLLVDRHHLVTEGSRSNVFIISGDTIFTAPLNMVLGGVTRRKAIDIINGSGLKLIEKAWKYTELLEKADALFLTGTSPKIIPVAKCDGARYDVENSVVREIMIGYDKMIRNYTDAHR